MDRFINVVWSGIWLGAAYGLIAVGLAASFRAARVVNLTVGAFFVVAALLAAWLADQGVGIAAGALLAIAFVIALSLVQERLILRRIATAPPKILLLGTLAATVGLTGVCGVWFGRDPITGSGFGGDHTVVLGAWHTTLNAVVLVVVGVVLAVGGWLAFERTATGRAIAAAGIDPGAAEMLGIDVWRLRAVAMGFAGLAGGLGGVLFLPLGVLDFSQALPMTLFGFVAAAIAGFRSIGLAFLAAVLFGVISALGTAYISSVFSQAVAFGLLAVVLLLAQHVSALKELS